MTTGLSIVYRREDRPAAAAIRSGDSADAVTAVNVGTIHYNLKQFQQAEQFYRCATEADSEYPLAFFNLGNVLDELNRRTEAVAAYRRALELVPNYADAHYNLALTLERLGHIRAALRHWKTYTRLDSVGPYAEHAKARVNKILAADPLKLCVTPHKQQPTLFEAL